MRDIISSSHVKYASMYPREDLPFNISAMLYPYYHDVRNHAIYDIAPHDNIWLQNAFARKSGRNIEVTNNLDNLTHESTFYPVVLTVNFILHYQQRIQSMTALPFQSLLDVRTIHWFRCLNKWVNSIQKHSNPNWKPW